jgi:hypothetical protein
MVYGHKGLNQIGNADDTAVFSMCLAIMPYISKGKKLVAMKTTGYETLCVTVMLCITAKGNKLPPYIILNRRCSKKIFAKIS